MELINTLYYKIGQPNTEYWTLLGKIKAQGKAEESRWEGDYLISTYIRGDSIYEVYENMKYGIQSKIKEYKKGESK